MYTQKALYLKNRLGQHKMFYTDMTGQWPAIQRALKHNPSSTHLAVNKENPITQKLPTSAKFVIHQNIALLNTYTGVLELFQK